MPGARRENQLDILTSRLVDLKPEFNSDNRRLYSNEHGAKILAEGEIPL
jgi:hypothetical protein